MTHRPCPTNQRERGSGPRRWLPLLFVVTLMTQVALGCLGAASRSAPSSPTGPTVTATAFPATATAAPHARTPSLAPTRTREPSPSRKSTATEKPTATAETATSAAAILGSLQRVDDYPLYTMRCDGPYTETASALALPGWAAERPAVPPWACSLFAALGAAEHRVYGRSFDWRFSPALLLFTDPPGAYASVSMVDIAYLVDAGDVHRLTELSLEERQPLLAAPLWPFDGMNEHGLVVGMAAVSDIQTPYDPARPTMDSLGIIREMLDHAHDAEEAVAILERFNVTWDGGPSLHYLIADATGHAVLVEFDEREMVLLGRPGGSPWHAATNHLRSTVETGRPSECWRYDTITRDLERNQGRLTPGGAMDLLAAVAQENTQWSVVYDLTDRGVHVVMGRAFARIHTFGLTAGDQPSAEATR